eukprot:GFUD01034402.1.p1 GENE.GFUD01034402.1~~GFUD01034402.1.p1  ORF type:complete len:474 (-),score=87.09 GFUD01034402.1:110-1531(-)
MMSKVLLLLLLFCSCILLLFDLTARVTLGDNVFRQPGLGAGGLIGNSKDSDNNTKLRDVLFQSVAKGTPSKQTRVLVKKSHAHTFGQNILESGLNMAISKLNYEFRISKDAIHANDVKKKVPKAIKTNRNKIKIAGNIPVGEHIPTNSTRQIIIATSWRSGSSFLGELLNQYPGTFYYFEPLHYYSYIKDRKKVQTETNFFNSLLSCRFDTNNSGFLKHVMDGNHSFLFKRHNIRLWNSCARFKPREKLCFSQDYLNLVCPLYPIRLIKTVRMRVRKTEELLRNSSVNLQVIVLVRDPRAVFNSRRSDRISSWCLQEHCSDPRVSCEDLSSDIRAAVELQRTFPGRVRLVRYEDLSLSPERTVRRLLEFLNLPWHEAIGHYIDTHTSADIKKQERNKETRKVTLVHDPYGTSRNSSAAVFAWRQSLDFQNVSQIQEVCREPMQELGYKIVSSKVQMLSQDRVIEKTADQVWPY